MKMIFIFIDGFGIGEQDKSKNPIIAANAPNIRHLLECHAVFPTDASMGVPGLPQSATGQTAIFTGVNASMVLGRHLHGQPTVTLKKLINNNNLFKELISMGLSVTNSNVYRGEYLVQMLESRDRRLRPSVTSVMAHSCGLRFRTVDDYLQGMGVYHDITGQILKDGGYIDYIITPEEAAKRLYNVSRDYDFTLYEHFMTDIIGHKMGMELAVSEIELLDRFLGSLLGLVDPENDIIVLTSDHGNIEDISVKTHTYNKVPTVILGKLSDSLKLKIDSLTDIAPAVINIFSTHRA